MGFFHSTSYVWEDTHSQQCNEEFFRKLPLNYLLLIQYHVSYYPVSMKENSGDNIIPNQSNRSVRYDIHHATVLNISFLTISCPSCTPHVPLHTPSPVLLSLATPSLPADYPISKQFPPLSFLPSPLFPVPPSFLPFSSLSSPSSFFFSAPPLSFSLSFFPAPPHSSSLSSPCSSPSSLPSPPTDRCDKSVWLWRPHAPIHVPVQAGYHQWFSHSFRFAALNYRNN